MPADKPIPLVGDSFQQWRKRYPTAADDLIKIVNLFYALELSIVVPGTTTKAKTALVVADSNIVLGVPVKFRAHIAHASATAASAAATVNLMLDEFTASTMNPP